MSARAVRTCFVTGGSGYLGQALIGRLIARGHRVRALVRAGSESRLPDGCTPILGDALNAASFADRVAPADTFVQLVGVPHPAPWKALAFERIDLRAGMAGVEAACVAGVQHFVYVSVARPAPVMRAYQRVRALVEDRIASRGLHATVLRPWYVLGPGHRWPLALRPFYSIAERLEPTRALAERCGLVTRAQIVEVMLDAIEHPPARYLHILDVRAIRARALATSEPAARD